ncbi:DEKNAAC101922 [Brettanomyces naardenensis]|uniref:DEKNAAC101922 n=1 Tax=Brettanomyces naardenensis TaxID=13370 RepID=A0A448YJE8_BRENA|nr:DEKNAAC101922 [Brettanomyces naardenensis]
MSTYSRDSQVLSDAHCHLSPVVSPARFENLKRQLHRKLDEEPEAPKYPFLNMMSTNFIDYKLIHELSKEFPGVVNANYGIHPWFSHLFTFTDFSALSSAEEIKRKHYGSVLLPKKEISKGLLDALPVPVYLPTYINEVEKFLSEDDTAGIGEIGIDKAFRVPMCGYLGSAQCQDWLDENKSVLSFGDGEAKREWSPFRTNMEHQMKVLEEFLQLAKRMRRSVSIHCVENHGKLYALMKKVFIDEDDNGYKSEWLDLHSYSGSVEQARLFTKTFPKLKFSLSSVLNLERYADRLQRCFENGSLSLNNVLIETDLGLDGLYWEDDKCVEDRYEFLVSSKKGVLNRHAELLADTMRRLHEMNSDLTLEKIDENYREYIGILV